MFIQGPCVYFDKAEIDQISVQVKEDLYRRSAKIRVGRAPNYLDTPISQTF